MAYSYRGWCAGHNPPFVSCGIRLIGLPAPQVVPHQRLFTLSTCRTAVSPLRTQHSQQLSMPHRHLPDGRFVSAPEPRLSPYALADVAILLVGGVSSSLFRGSKATRQLASPKCNRWRCAIKILGNLCVLWCEWMAEVCLGVLFW